MAERMSAKTDKHSSLDDDSDVNSDDEAMDIQTG